MAWAALVRASLGFHTHQLHALPRTITPLCDSIRACPPTFVHNTDGILLHGTFTNKLSLLVGTSDRYLETAKACRPLLRPLTEHHTTSHIYFQVG